MTLHLQQRQDLIAARRQRRKLAKRARVRRQIVRFFFLFSILAVAAGASLFLPWSLADREKDIIVKGNQVVAAGQVRALLGSCIGTPVYRLNPRALEAEVRSLDAVRYAYVRRYALPRPRLFVYVLEEFPWATFAPAPDLIPPAVISETGRMISIRQFPGIIQPELKIFGPPDLKMKDSEVSQWAAWVAYIAALAGRKVDYIDMRQEQCIWVGAGSLRLKLGVADSSLTRRLGRLSSVLPVLDKIEGQLEYIDLSLDNNIPLKVHKTAPGHLSAGNS